MSTYVIGDIQGCFDELQQLLNKIAFNPTQDTLWFVGDLVNRGTGSLQTLRFVKSLGGNAVTVLGNHDLHLLALFCGIRPTGKDPTLEPILSAPDAHSLMLWLMNQPLLHREDNYVMVHAGLHCDWSIDTAESLAREIKAKLAQAISANTQAINVDANAETDIVGEVDTDALRTTIASLYGPTKGTWSENAGSDKRLRYAVNCFTRMRFCDQYGTPNFKNSGAPGSQPDTLVPWFQLQNESQQKKTILIGHWAAMGLKTINNLYALDSGCVWGNCLTAMRLSDKKQFHIKCTNYQR